MKAERWQIGSGAPSRGHLWRGIFGARPPLQPLQGVGFSKTPTQGVALGWLVFGPSALGDRPLVFGLSALGNLLLAKARSKGNPKPSRPSPPRDLPLAKGATGFKLRGA